MGEEEEDDRLVLYGLMLRRFPVRCAPVVKGCAKGRGLRDRLCSPLLLREKSIASDSL